jgi:WD40 repeat protein
MRRITPAILAVCLAAAPAVADPLPEGVVARVGSGHFWDDSLESLAFSADGKTLFTWGKNLCGWAVATGRCYFQRPINWTAVRSLHSDGNVLRFVDGSWPQLLDARTGKRTRTQRFERLERQSAQDGAGAISPDGRWVAIPVTESISQLFDLETGKAVRTFHGRGPGYPHYHFSPDGKFLAIAAGTDGEVALPVFDTATGDVVVTIRDPGKAIRAAAVSVRRVRVATMARIGRDSDTVALWDGTNGKLVRRLGTSGEYSNGVAISPDGKCLAFADLTRRELKIVNLSDGQEISRARYPEGVATLAYSPDGSTLAVATRRHGVTLLDAATLKPLPLSADDLGDVWTMQFTGGGTRLLVAATDIAVRDWRTGKVVRRLADPRATVRRAFAVNSDGRRLAVADREGTVRVLDADTGRTELTNAGHGPNPFRLRFTPDNQTLISLGTSDTPCAWSLATGRQVRFPTLQWWQNSLSGITPDGQWFETVGTENEYSLRIWRPWDGRLVRQINLPRFPVHHVEFSPDGRLVALAHDGTQKDIPRIVIWDTIANVKRAAFALSWSWQISRSMAFSPDGRVLVAADHEYRGIRQYEVATGTERPFLRGHQTTIEHFAFSPDSRYLAAASSDAPIFVWDLWHDSKKSTTPTGEETNRLWKMLADPNAATAFRAMCRLLAAPPDAYTILRANLKPEEPLPAQWLTDLADKQFAVRDRAFAELAKVADRHEPALRRVHERSNSPEARRRLQLLLDRCDPPSAERLRQARSVEVLERIATPDAVALLRDLAAGAENAALTLDARAALGRVVAR